MASGLDLPAPGSSGCRGVGVTRPRPDTVPDTGCSSDLKSLSLDAFSLERVTHPCCPPRPRGRQFERQNANPSDTAKLTSPSQFPSGPTSQPLWGLFCTVSSSCCDSVMLPDRGAMAPLAVVSHGGAIQPKASDAASLLGFRGALPSIIPQQLGKGPQSASISQGGKTNKEKHQSGQLGQAAPL